MNNYKEKPEYDVFGNGFTWGAVSSPTRTDEELTLLNNEAVIWHQQRNKQNDTNRPRS